MIKNKRRMIILLGLLNGAFDDIATGEVNKR
jgi:hypothetical protein